jgi:hypothetical protein
LRFGDSIPSFMQLSTSFGTIGTNVVLSLLLLFLILLACTVFNQTLEANQAELARTFAGVGAPLAALFGWLRWRREHAKGPSTSWLRVAGILLIVAAIYSGLDPDFGLNSTTLGLVLSLTIGVGLLTLLYEGAQILLSSRAYGAHGELEIAPLGIVIAAVSVLVTRVTNLHPGIVLGVIAGAAMSLEDERQEGRVVFGAMLGTVAVSLLALLLLHPLRSLSEDSSAWYAEIPETVAVTLFVGGLEGLLFNLLPLEFMEGIAVWRWSRLAWAATAVTV